jgi:sec-independent protein translocase protein TatB
MFNIGGGEVLVIALVALIVLGPQRLPEAARQVGKVMGDVRRLSNGFQNELKGAFSEAESSAPSTPRRDVLGAGSASATTAASSSAAGVSRQAPARRQPLRAAPVASEEPRRAKRSAAGKGATGAAEKPATTKAARSRKKGP